MDARTPRLMRSLAERVPATDTLYRTKLIEQAAKLEDVIAMGLGDPDLPTPPHVVEAARDAIARGETRYTHPAGMPKLRQAIADLLRQEYGLHYSAEETIVTAGTQEGVMLLMLALVDPGDEVLLPSPRFTSYDTAVELCGGKVVSVPTYQKDEFALLPSEIEARITPRTKMLVLITPNNPTGAVTPPNAIREIAEIAKRHDIIVVSDEIYAKLLFDDAEHLSIGTLPGMRERTITMNGFSKSHAMTGWRIGYLAAPQPFIQRMVEPRHTLSINAATPSQWAALAAATGPQSVVKDMLDIYESRRDVLLKGLDELGFTYGRPAGAFYVYVNIEASGVPATQFCNDLLREARVLVSPGMLFADPDDRYVRMSLLQPKARIEEALGRIMEARRRLFRG
ncbi:pyridoxal phosphate-dependent aminotransferase [Microvirga sp. BT689]|uniref:pyridoxal phosphate-dependent aminotransferase n=1 Tax=Microvirga arvi TaxID=2778731 RepID=UPI0019526810|nr:pyridoxal phosphate-dependent aminotransferase [Microvirga arvi]MBM6581880.1 pyridoxal phosphate-dependent aminotransferase [Microvirga arvi]